MTSEFGKAKANFSIQIIENAKGNSKEICQGTKGLELKMNNQLVWDPVVLAQELNSFFIKSIDDLVKQFISFEGPDQ